MRHICILCFLACWPMYGQSAALKWPVISVRSLAQNATDIGTVEALINTVLGPEAITARLRAFRFVPLETIKRVDLIASIDASGRGVFNAFIAVWPSSGTYATQYCRQMCKPCWRGTLLTWTARECTRSSLADSRGAIRGYLRSQFPGIVYTPLDTVKWIDVSDRYPQLHQADLSLRSSLLLRVADAALSGDKEALQVYKGCALFVRYKYDRAVLHISDEGLAAALDWAESSVPNIRVLAVETLGEIADPRAISALRGLAQDPQVGVLAKGALARMGAGPDRK